MIGVSSIDDGGIVVYWMIMNQIAIKTHILPIFPKSFVKHVVP